MKLKPFVFKLVVFIATMIACVGRKAENPCTAGGVKSFSDGSGYGSAAAFADPFAEKTKNYVAATTAVNSCDYLTYKDVQTCASSFPDVKSLTDTTAKALEAKSIILCSKEADGTYKPHAFKCKSTCATMKDPSPDQCDFELKPATAVVDNTTQTGTQTGTQTATDGTQTATDGTQTATDGTQTATDGTQTATDGTQTASNGTQATDPLINPVTQPSTTDQTDDFSNNDQNTGGDNVDRSVKEGGCD